WLRRASSATPRVARSPNACSCSKKGQGGTVSWKTCPCRRPCCTTGWTRCLNVRGALEQPLPFELPGAFRVGQRLRRGGSKRVSKKGAQHSTIFTARPPCDVSLYLLIISAPVSRIVLIT